LGVSLNVLGIQYGLRGDLHGDDVQLAVHLRGAAFSQAQAFLPLRETSRRGRAAGASLSAGCWSRILPEVSLLSRIVVDPAVCHGKPVIRGLRYPVESMLEYLAGGDSIEDILAEFPDLERDDLLACLQYAATAIRLKTLHVPTAA
jgi:uncharacterized protein (DUF433 family)